MKINQKINERAMKALFGKRYVSFDQVVKGNVIVLKGNLTNYCEEGIAWSFSPNPQGTKVLVYTRTRGWGIKNFCWDGNSASLDPSGYDNPVKNVKFKRARI
jgi:hypothetical protein